VNAGAERETRERDGRNGEQRNLQKETRDEQVYEKRHENAEKLCRKPADQQSSRNGEKTKVTK